MTTPFPPPDARIAALRKALRSERIAAWRQRPQAMPERVPAVFAFLAAG